MQAVVILENYIKCSR